MPDKAPPLRTPARPEGRRAGLGAALPWIQGGGLGIGSAQQDVGRAQQWLAAALRIDRD